MAPRDRSWLHQPGSELQGDPIQKKEEECVGRIVVDGGGEKTARGEDERWRAAVGFFARMKWNLKTVPLGQVTLMEGLAWTYTLQRFLEGAFWKKLLPKRGEVEVGVGEEEESDLEFGVFAVWVWLDL